MLTLGFLIIISNLFLIASSSSIPDTHQTVFNILTGVNYSKDVRPLPTNSNLGKYGNATTVKVNIFIRKIVQIDDIKMQITLQLAFRQMWMDKRLEYQNNETSFEYVTLNEAMADKICKQGKNTYLSLKVHKAITRF
jgi:hypothetical protein